MQGMTARHPHTVSHRVRTRGVLAVALAALGLSWPIWNCLSAAQGDAAAEPSPAAVAQPAESSLPAADLLAPATELPLTPGDSDAPTPPQPAAASEVSPPLIPPGQFPLDFIQDRTDLVGTADVECYYGLLDYARHVAPAVLREAANEFREERWSQSEFRDWPLDEFPLYYDLTRHPEAYRGKPVSLYGHLRLHHVDHPVNSYGLDPVHVAYLYTDDSQHHPTRIVFTENPDGIPVGEDVVNGISVTGYFLKLYLYSDRGEKGRYMPLLLAREVRWSRPGGRGLSTEMQLVMAAVIIGIVFGLVMFIRRTQRRDAAARARERATLGRDERPDLTHLP